MANKPISNDDTDLDQLISETASMPAPSSNKSYFNEAKYLANVDCVALTSTYLAFLCSYHKTGIIITIFLIGLITGLVFICTTSYNPPTIENDYSNIHSVLDLEVGKVDHWCLTGGDEGCSCPDPLFPVPRKANKVWSKRHRWNKLAVKRALARNKEVDVIFIGDELAEAWADFKEEEDEENEVEEKEGAEESYSVRSNRAFQRYFGKKAKFSGISLGAEGDTSSNLLWRLLNGEMQDLEPKVWWIIIGMNDLVVHGCSEEVVLMGILRIAEEIILKKPTAKVVLNGMLPMARMQDKLKENGDKKRVKRWMGPNYWASIRLVNKHLEEFSGKHNRVEYFNPAPYFVNRSGKQPAVKNMIQKKFPNIPTVAGYKEWLEGISNKLDKYLNSEEKEEALNNNKSDNVNTEEVEENTEDIEENTEDVEEGSGENN